MRILHVNKFLYRRGGAEGYLQDVAAMQVQAGHEVAFFGMDHPDNEPQAYAPHFPSHLEFEPAPDDVRGKLSALGRMLWSTSAQRGIAAVADDFRPDVVHLHNIYHQLSPSVLAPFRSRRVPCVLTLHDYKLACPTYQLRAGGQLCQACVEGGPWQALRRRCKDGSLAASGAAAFEVAVHRRAGAYDGVARLLCPSRFLRDVMDRAGLGADRLHVLNNPVDTSASQPQEHPGRGVVAAGRLSEEKGFDTLVEAVARLPWSAGDGPLLDIAGDGPARDELERLATRVAPGRVRFHGRLRKDELHELLRRAAVAAVPSRWYENQPLAVLEAFACGLPVVATSLGGLPELVQPGVDGELVPAEDPAALAAALAPLVADPVLAHAMGRRGRAKVERDFSPSDHLTALLEHYELAGATPAGAVAKGG